MDLETALKNVNDEATFMAFIDLYKDSDQAKEGALGIPLDKFVEEVKTYAREEEVRAQTEVMVAQMGTPWRKFANFLFTGQMFE